METARIERSETHIALSAAIQDARNSFRNTHSKAKAEADAFRGAQRSARQNGEAGPCVTTLTDLAWEYYQTPSAYTAAKKAFNDSMAEARQSMQVQTNTQ